ncbi:LpqN/LpqT family lipoprotein [Mycobacterium sp. IDR2000157661]|uniref:LpqN/LpqT family lipoprotein n=1 Tax=Mycobacterium sp. IDR2000157661 TaxID=2867005 RepID=UPI001EEC98AF|nr:LpqN/LpqT family lipoprotein [Mycobacterium sp. IDR2000157661]ULE31318.1 LpqN/LpqT family lipoprotein [Mycobacterium sp. IDR2000157661]
MKRFGFGLVAGVVALAAVTGCGTEPPNYQSVWSTTASPTTTTAPDAGKPVPIAAFLEQEGVVGDPVFPERLTDLTVGFPTPPGWEPYFNTNFAPGTRVIAKGDTYPIAMLVVLKLTGDFDVDEAIKHGYVDAEMSQNFTRLNASMEPFKGFPSAMIEGSYDLNGTRMHSYNRIVIATGAPPEKQRYLIQFTVTGFANKAAEEAPDIESIIGGFTVAQPKAPPPPR